MFKGVLSFVVDTKLGRAGFVKGNKADDIGFIKAPAAWKLIAF